MTDELLPASAEKPEVPWRCPHCIARAVRPCPHSAHNWRNEVAGVAATPPDRPSAAAIAQAFQENAGPGKFVHAEDLEWAIWDRDYDAIRAALAALPGGGVAFGGCGETDAAKRCIGCLHQFAPTWRPIETAPERGSFLIYGGEWVGESGRRYKSEIAQVNRANGGKFYLADAEDFWPWVENATHWMPKPNTPTPPPHEADRNG